MSDVSKIKNEPLRLENNIEPIRTFLAAGSLASSFARATRFWSLACVFAFFFRRTTSSLLTLFFIAEGSKRLVGITEHTGSGFNDDGLGTMITSSGK